jgi:hypothetical protein
VFLQSAAGDVLFDDLALAHVDLQRSAAVF